MDYVARAIDIAHLKVERFVEAQSTAIERGEVGAIVQGRHGLGGGVDLWRLRTVGSRCSVSARMSLQGFPAAFEALLVEETEGAITDAHGAWREAIDVFSMQEIVLECCSEMRSGICRRTEPGGEPHGHRTVAYVRSCH